MPKRVNRSAAIAPDAQVRYGANPQDGNGVQTFDGRENLQSGTKHSMVPAFLDGKDVVTGVPTTVTNK